MADIDTIISDNVGLVYAQLNRFNLSTDQDAESDAYEALYRAALTYAPDKGIEFSTYATCCIYNALAGHMRSLKSKHITNTLSLDDPVSFEDSCMTRIDTICIDNSVETEFIQKERSYMLWKAIEMAKGRLSGSSLNVVEHWIASDFTAKQKELANMVGVSQSYASTAIGHFKKYLREALDKIQY